MWKRKSGALSLYCRPVRSCLLVHATLFALTLWLSAARNRWNRDWRRDGVSSSIPASSSLATTALADGGWRISGRELKTADGASNVDGRQASAHRRNGRAVLASKLSLSSRDHGRFFTAQQADFIRTYSAAVNPGNMKTGENEGGKGRRPRATERSTSITNRNNVSRIEHCRRNQSLQSHCVRWIRGVSLRPNTFTLGSCSRSHICLSLAMTSPAVPQAPEQGWETYERHGKTQARSLQGIR
ncbi:unnamed protein product [Leuciscus chuanchicus]